MKDFSEWKDFMATKDEERLLKDAKRKFSVRKQHIKIASAMRYKMFSRAVEISLLTSRFKWQWIQEHSMLQYKM